jgi:asparagine synthase (glutamine-hydrolysing)
MSAIRPIIPRIASPLQLDGRLRKLSRFLSLGTNDQFILFNACNVLPGDLEDLGMWPSDGFSYRTEILQEAKNLYPGDLTRQAMYSDQHTFLCSLLDRNDRMTMGASVECRVPFLDYRIVETLAGMPSKTLLPKGQSKLLLRTAVGQRLPEAVLRQRKWGFGVPWRKYLRSIPELRQLVYELPDNAPVSTGPFDPVRLRKMVNEFLSGSDTRAELMLQLVMVSIWYQTFRVRHAELRRNRRVEVTTP